MGALSSRGPHLTVQRRGVHTTPLTWRDSALVPGRGPPSSCSMSTCRTPSCPAPASPHSASSPQSDLGTVPSTKSSTFFKHWCHLLQGAFPSCQVGHVPPLCPAPQSLIPRSLILGCSLRNDRVLLIERDTQNTGKGVTGVIPDQGLSVNGLSDGHHVLRIYMMNFLCILWFRDLS